MKKSDITVDDLLEKIPNKYELAIVAGRAARELFLKGEEKSKVMNEVFEEIIDGRVRI